MKLALRVSMVCLALGCLTGQASADIMYKLVDVKLGYLGGEQLGELTGWFTISDDLLSVTSAEIKATDATTSGGFTYDAITYAFNPGAATNLSSLSQNIFLLQYGTGLQRLQLTFATSLTGTGETNFTDPSSESQFPTGPRIVLSGKVEAESPQAIPEPTSLATLFIGAPIALAFARRCRRMAKRG